MAQRRRRKINAELRQEIRGNDVGIERRQGILTKEVITGAEVYVKGVLSYSLLKFTLRLIQEIKGDEF